MKIFERLRSTKNLCYIPSSVESLGKSSHTVESSAIESIVDGSGPKKNVTFADATTTTQHISTVDVDIIVELWYGKDELNSFEKDAKGRVNKYLGAKDVQEEEKRWLRALSKAFVNTTRITTIKERDALMDSTRKLGSSGDAFGVEKWVIDRLNMQQKEQLHSSIQRLQKDPLLTKQDRETEIYRASAKLSLSRKLFAMYMGRALEAELRG